MFDLTEVHELELSRDYWQRGNEAGCLMRQPKVASVNTRP